MAILCTFFIYFLIGIHAPIEKYLIVDDNWIFRSGSESEQIPSAIEVSIGQGRPLVGLIMYIGRSFESISSIDKFQIVRWLGLVFNSIFAVFFAYLWQKQSASKIFGCCAGILLLATPSFCIYYTAVPIMSVGILLSCLSCFFLTCTLQKKKIVFLNAHIIISIIILCLGLATYQPTTASFCSLAVIYLFSEKELKSANNKARVFIMIFITSLILYTILWKIVKLINPIELGIGYSPRFQSLEELCAKIMDFVFVRIFYAFDLFNFDNTNSSYQKYVFILFAITGIFAFLKNNSDIKQKIIFMLSFLILFFLSDFAYLAAPKENANRDNFTLLLGLQMISLTLFMQGLSSVFLKMNTKNKKIIFLTSLFCFSMTLAFFSQSKVHSYHVKRFSEEFSILKDEIQKFLIKNKRIEQIRAVHLPYEHQSTNGKNEYSWKSYGSTFYSHWILRNALQTLNVKYDPPIIFIENGKVSTTQTVANKCLSENILKLKLGGSKIVELSENEDKVFTIERKSKINEVWYTNIFRPAGYPTILHVPEITARVLRIELVPYQMNYLHLAEVEIFCKNPQNINFALRKPTRQSSTAFYGKSLSDYAVDGDTKDKKKFAHTNFEGGAWWEVDLTRPIEISEIRIWNIESPVADRLSNFTVILEK